jgi:hypothetical protein
MEAARILLVFGSCMLIGTLLLRGIGILSEHRHGMRKRRRWTSGKGRTRTHGSRYDAGILDSMGTRSKAGTRRVRKVARNAIADVPDVVDAPDVEDTFLIV